ncbi:uncharacterized protein J3R85_013760 [Psidium guajava]|nr:uncharacterized protein J3R85_013760 [Psidium guajava]
MQQEAVLSLPLCAPETVKLSSVPFSPNHSQSGCAAPRTGSLCFKLVLPLQVSLC